MTDPQLIKAITSNLESTYNNLRRSASSISGLLAVGRATCDELKVYNLWALATYNAQRGMLATLRNAGENVPTLPTYPTLFAWRGQAGTNAINFDCSGQESSLSGLAENRAGRRVRARAMKRALSGPDAQTVYVSSDQVEAVTVDQADYDTASGPSFADLANQGQLGIAPIVILIIAGLSVAVYFAIDAIAAYLTESDIQRETTERTAIQSQAFATYTQARLSCYADCTGRGGTTEACVDTCARLVDKPDIKIDSARGIASWGFFQWIGFTVVAAAGGVAAWKLWEKKKRDGRILPELPSF